MLQQEKTLGKLVGISDVDAYRQVAEHLNNQGITANLNWNAIHDPLLYTSSTDYELFLKNPNTIFTNLFFSCL